MKVAVLGLWHLGIVTAGCVAEAGIETTGIDFDDKLVSGLSVGVTPLFEPGLSEQIEAGLASGSLAFTNDPAAAADADILWVTYDTPIDDNDVANIAFVKNRFFKIVPYLKPGVVVLISSQLPVGTTRQWLKEAQQSFSIGPLYFAYSPENLRLGKALMSFKKPERIVIGLDDDEARILLKSLLEVFCENLIWVSIESAEMTKHALNAFLATCVTFINEIATVCEKVGADAGEVELALRAESRIGQKAYIRPGGAFAGGTLARDVSYLTCIASQHDLSIPMIDSILESNNAHRHWAFRQIESRFCRLPGLTVCVLGLAYKPDTSEIRRSIAVELCRRLLAHEIRVRAYDPAVTSLPSDLHCVELYPSAADAMNCVDVVVVATEWAEFLEIAPDMMVGAIDNLLVIDANGFLGNRFACDPRIKYLTVGRAQ